MSNGSSLDLDSTVPGIKLNTGHSIRNTGYKGNRQMESFRFVHAADLHIGSPFKGLMEVEPEIGQQLKEATHLAFQNLIRLCIEEQADFLVVAGDVYDGADRSPQAQLRFRKGLTDLAEQGIESFVVHGNHDPLDGRFSSISWPEGVHIFGAAPSWKTATRNGEPLSDIQGASYPTQVVTDNLALRFSSPRNANIFNIGMLHCNVGGIEGHDNYAPCSVDDLARIGLDYWALGHIHTRQTLLDKSPLIVYPGNTQGRDPGESGARGCVIVDVGPDGIPMPQFRPLDVVRWESGQISITDISGIDRLSDKIFETLDDLRAGAEGRNVVCRLALVGRGPMHRELASENAIDGFLDELRSNARSTNPWVWIERLSNQTLPEIDIETRGRQDDFLGAILKRAETVDSAVLDKELMEVFSGRRDRLPKPDATQIAEWIEEAKWHLAELLEPEN